MVRDNTISVIIPTFNSANYIERTMHTIYQQTLLPYEVIIVDDGSSDNTVDVVKDYVQKNKNAFANVKVICQDNMGAGAARNRAIKEASGEWIAFLDSDDLWEENKLELIDSVMRDNPSVAIITHDEYSVEGENFNERKLCPLHENYQENMDLFLQLYQGNFFSTSCMVVKKSIIEQAGGFDITLRSAQDYDLWIRIAMRGELYFIDQPLETYVVREGNITSNTYRRYLCEMKICKKYINELKKRYGTNAARKIVRKRVWMIHKVETYIAFTQKKLCVSLKILLHLIPEMMVKI